MNDLTPAVTPPTVVAAEAAVTLLMSRWAPLTKVERGKFEDIRSALTWARGEVSRLSARIEALEAGATALLAALDRAHGRFGLTTWTEEREALRGLLSSPAPNGETK